jgi:hypothetical protein
VGHGERRRELERRFPGWEIWYVPREPDGATWRALDTRHPPNLAALLAPRRLAAGGPGGQHDRESGPDSAPQAPLTTALTR